jgi:hypothetical protein
MIGCNMPAMGQMTDTSPEVPSASTPEGMSTMHTTTRRKGAESQSSRPPHRAEGPVTCPIQSHAPGGQLPMLEPSHRTHRLRPANVSGRGLPSRNSGAACSRRFACYFPDCRTQRLPMAGRYDRAEATPILGPLNSCMALPRVAAAGSPQSTHGPRTTIVPKTLTSAHACACHQLALAQHPMPRFALNRSHSLRNRDRFPQAWRSSCSIREIPSSLFPTRAFTFLMINQNLPTASTGSGIGRIGRTSALFVRTPRSALLAVQGISKSILAHPRHSFRICSGYLGGGNCGI